MHSKLASQPYSPLHTLMTADYLLTARDLPGWGGKFKMFTMPHLIKKTFKFLERASFANDVLVREMKILKEIAKQHDLLDLYNELLNKTKRKLIKAGSVDGFIVTPNVFEISGEEVGISNIYDAALATPFTYKFLNKITLKFYYKWLVRTIKVVLNTMKYTKITLPKV